MGLGTLVCFSLCGALVAQQPGKPPRNENDQQRHQTGLDHAGEPADDGQDSLALANRLGEKEDWVAATDAYLSAYRSDPNLFNSSSSSAYKHVQVFKKAGRLKELANFFDQARVHRMGHHNGLDRLFMACRTKPETRAAGYELLKRIFNNPPYRADWSTTSNLILRSIRWSSVPDPVFYLRCVLLPTDFEQPGWQRLSVTSASDNQYGVDGHLTLARPLYHDREALRQFATEIRELIEKHPKWVSGWALLAFIEAESGNTRAAVDVLRERFLDADSDEIPPSAAWLLGECLAGKDDELNRVVIELLEPVVRKIATLTYKRPAGTHGPTGPKSLRLSPIKTLAGLYAKYGRELEARQLLYGLVDSTNQHPLVEGYAGNTMGTTLSCTGQRCLACHQVERGESNFPSYYDFTELSGAMTDIGYPVDSLIALARMDKSYGNAFDSAKGWLDDRPQWAGYLMFKIEHGYFDEQQSKAERRVTPGTVLEALELDTFQRSSRVDGKVVLDLMLSVRGEGPDAKATVFSPVVDILKLAAESKGTVAAKDIAELDKRLVALSEQHPKSIEAGIAATVFAFLRNDLESAKDRLKRLQAITDYPKSDGAAFWLAARHALQHDQTRIIGAVLAERALTAAETRIIGAVLAERALTAAETQPDSGLKEAILHEQSGIRTK